MDAEERLYGVRFRRVVAGPVLGGELLRCCKRRGLDACGSAVLRRIPDQGTRIIVYEEAYARSKAKRSAVRYPVRVGDDGRKGNALRGPGRDRCRQRDLVLVPHKIRPREIRLDGGALGGAT